MTRLCSVFSVMFATVALAAPAIAADGAVAKMVDPSGKTLGTLELRSTPNGVLISGELSGLPPGPHGFHIHEKGACTPNFDAAGGHFNPTGAEHGFRDPAGPHAGDLPNIVVPQNGRIKIEVYAPGVMLDQGKNSLLADDGTAIVVHAQPDDYTTDPAGAAGARIACGVIQKK